MAQSYFVYPMDLYGVHNYANFAQHLHRGAQPTPEGFLELKRMGVRTILDLRDNKGEDKSSLKHSGLEWNYIRMDMKSENPQDAHIAKVVSAFLVPYYWPTFVHCHHGADRTGTVVAVYRMLVQGWGYQRAFEEMGHFEFNPKYTQILQYLRNLDENEAARQALIGKINGLFNTNGLFGVPDNYKKFKTYGRLS